VSRLVSLAFGGLEAAMRKVAVWFLTIAGLIGLLTALSFEGHGGGVEIQGQGAAAEPIRQPMVWRVGFPDKWLEFESQPNAHVAGVNVLSWSFVILSASVCALCTALLWRRRASPPKPR
jgi:hypothetical protein